MPPTPILSGKKLLNILKKNGFLVLRQKGSHVFVEKFDGSARSIIPVHSNEDLGKGLLKKILNDLELTVEEFITWL